MRSFGTAVRRGCLLLGAALALAAAGCAVRQLDHFKTWAAQGNDAAIVAESVTCTPQDRGCDQLRLIRGMACYRQAKAGVEPKARYECGVEELTRGLSVAEAGGTSPAELKPYREALLESIRERQDLSKSWAEATPYTDLLRQTAAGYRRDFADEPAGYYYGATALLAEANRRLAQESSPERSCGLLSEALRLLDSGAARPGALKENIEVTRRQVKATLRSECAQ